MSASEFWAEVAAKGLRGEQPPSWVRENLRARVSIGLRLIPGNPDHRPRRQDDDSEPEATP